MKGKEIFIWILVFVVGSLIVSAILDPSIFSNWVDKIKSDSAKSQASQDPLVSKCLVSFSQCESVTETKYDDLSINLIKVERFDNRSRAEDFFNTWKSPAQMYDLNFMTFGGGEPEEYPQVLIASKIRGPEGESPVVIFCNKEGQISKLSKIILLCG